MKAALNRIAAMLGYVPAPAKLAPVGIAIKLDIDSASLDASVAKLEQVTAIADDTELALKRITLAAHVAAKALDQVQALVPVEAQFATTELKTFEPAADTERDKLFCEMRALVWEIRQDRAERRTAGASIATSPATGAAASGLPG